MQKTYVSEFGRSTHLSYIRLSVVQFPSSLSHFNIYLLVIASATGFVTFKTRRAQVTAAQMPVLSQQYPKVRKMNDMCIWFI